MFKHTIQGYKGITTIQTPTAPNNIWKIEYAVPLEKHEGAKIARLVSAFCKKELVEYNNLPDMIICSQNDKLYTVTIQSPNGLIAINERLLPCCHALDIFLHYSTMDLASLGKHFRIFQEAIREQGQWHWLKEAPGQSISNQ